MTNKLREYTVECRRSIKGQIIVAWRPKGERKRMMAGGDYYLDQVNFQGYPYEYLPENVAQYLRVDQGKRNPTLGGIDRDKGHLSKTNLWHLLHSLEHSSLGRMTKVTHRGLVMYITVAVKP